MRSMLVPPKNVLVDTSLTTLSTLDVTSPWELSFSPTMSIGKTLIPVPESFSCRRERIIANIKNMKEFIGEATSDSEKVVSASGSKLSFHGKTERGRNENS